MGDKDKAKGKIEIGELIGSIKSYFAPSPKGNLLVGVDIGHSAVKVAELQGSEESKKYHLTRYASVALSEGAIIEGEIQNREEIITAVKKAIEMAEVSTNNVCIGLSGQDSISKKLQVTGESEEEIEDHVIWESEHYLPFPADDAKIDIHIIGENQGGGTDVIIGAAKYSTVEKYKSIATDAGLKVWVVDLKILAISNVIDFVIKEQFRDQQNSLMVLDIGASETGVIIYRKGVIVYTKEINMGGLLITEEIQRGMHVNYQEAEDLKFSSDISGGVPENVAEIIDAMSNKIVNEISKIVDFYQTSVSEESVDTCIITGGSSLVKKIIEKLGEDVKMDVINLNPLDKITIDKKRFEQEDIDNIIYKGAVAIGLAMRESV